MADERDFVHKMSAYEVSFPCVKSRYRPATTKNKAETNHIVCLLRWVVR